MKKNKFRNKNDIVPYLVPYKPKRNSPDITGKVFNKITVVGVSDESGMWWCECECNSEVVFKVAKNSLLKGLTQSCGCLRKNNGAHNKSSLSDAQSKIHNFKISKFSGWRSKCTGVCITCGTKRTVEQAYFLRNNICCKQEYNKQDLLTRDLVYDVKTNTLFCKFCKQTNLNFNKPCICKLPNTSSISSVYILQDKIRGLFKIGKGDEPYSRTNTVISSAKLNESLNFSIYKILWVAGSSLAYRLESILHARLKDYRDSSYSFDGSTETFICSEDVLLEALVLEEQAINLCNRGITPPVRYSINLESTAYLESLSIEYEGFWFPSKSAVSRFYNINHSLVNTLLQYNTFEDFTKRKPRIDTTRYDIDWGGGIIGNIHQLARDNGIQDGCLWHRVNRLGMSMKEALSMKVDSHKYITINNKDYLKADTSKYSGVIWSTISKRLKRGWELKYAILELGVPKDFIMNIAGNIYSKQQILTIFGLNKNIWILSKKLPTIRDVLLHHKVISEEDYFEIIPLP